MDRFVSFWWILFHHVEDGDRNGCLSCLSLWWPQIDSACSDGQRCFSCFMVIDWYLCFVGGDDFSFCYFVKKFDRFVCGVEFIKNPVLLCSNQHVYILLLCL